ncbi:hypothetical protein ACFWD7_56030 [Streptomyces mirabilis]|uniref:hypothetical protein n=1 Tax=Streptomyces mirabilis TaxID=68239 RepID=UPI003685EDE7
MAMPSVIKVYVHTEMEMDPESKRVYAAREAAEMKARAAVEMKSRAAAEARAAVEMKDRAAAGIANLAATNIKARDAAAAHQLRMAFDLPVRPVKVSDRHRRHGMVHQPDRDVAPGPKLAVRVSGALLSDHIPFEWLDTAQYVATQRSVALAQLVVGQTGSALSGSPSATSDVAGRMPDVAAAAASTPVARGAAVSSKALPPLPGGTTPPVTQEPARRRV